MIEHLTILTVVLVGDLYLSKPTNQYSKKKKKVNFIISVLQLNKRIKRSPSDFNKVTSTLFRLVLV